MSQKIELNENKKIIKNCKTQLQFVVLKTFIRNHEKSQVLKTSTSKDFKNQEERKNKYKLMKL